VLGATVEYSDGTSGPAAGSKLNYHISMGESNAKVTGGKLTALRKGAAIVEVIYEPWEGLTLKDTDAVTITAGKTSPPDSMGTIKAAAVGTGKAGETRIVIQSYGNEEKMNGCELAYRVYTDAAQAALPVFDQDITSWKTLPSSGVISARDGNIVVVAKRTTEQPKLTVASSSKVRAYEYVSIKGPLTISGVSTGNSANIPLLLNGQKKDKLATADIKTDKGTVAITVKLDRKAVLEAVNNSEDSVRTIRLPVEGELDSLDFQLDADIIKFLGEKEITLEVETGIGSYILPASKIIPENMKKQLENTNLKEVMVSIKIAKAEEKYANTLKKNQANKKFQIVTQPVEFSIVCSIGGKDLEVKSFDSIVKKLLPVSENVDGRKVTTAVVIEPNGAIRHVPTKVVIREGKYFAEVSSLTNSVYSLVYNSRSYADTKKHWAEEAINDLASRMVVNGVAKNLFNPNRDITRAEFAAIIVTALGLKPGAGTDSFSDVKAADWYAGYIETATEYKLISGYGNGRFGPKDKITREQAMSIIGKAMSITGLKMELTSQESNELLAGFSDGSKAADYSKNSIAACVNSGIVSGRKGNFIAPKENITRAEVVIMVRNLLKESGLI
jgi:hypothetical protein